jgi:hypothetical protein
VGAPGIIAGNERFLSPSTRVAAAPKRLYLHIPVGAVQRVHSGLLFAPDSIAVSIKAVDVIADDSYGTGHIFRTVPATALTVDITRDRNAGTRVIGVAV